MITAVEALGKLAVKSLELFPSLHMNLKRVELLQESDITAYSLTDYSTLIEVASEKGYIEATEMDKLIKWRKNP